MDIAIWGILLTLIGQACLVSVIFLFLFHLQFFKRMLVNKETVINQVVLAIIFGILAIYGTYSGVQTSGAIANIRNLSPMIGGFIGGPWAGLGAGLIGGVHRYLLGGFTAVPCAIGTIASGLVAGLLLIPWQNKIGIWKPVAFAFVMETIDMLLLLLIAKPFDDALRLVKIIAVPMILGDTIGIIIFSVMLKDIKSGLTKGT